MPDWSYQTLFRPLLFLLPAERARDLTLQAIGTLAKCPGGPWVIEWMGHMQPPVKLAKTFEGIVFPTPVGLGAGLDPDAKALAALTRFGFGYVELGPVTRQPLLPTGLIERDQCNRSIRYPDRDVWANQGLDSLLERLQSLDTNTVPLGARLGFRPGASMEEATHERRELIRSLSPYCRFFTLDMRCPTGDSGWTDDEWREHLRLLSASTEHPIVIAVPPDTEKQEAMKRLQAAQEAGASGMLAAGGVESGGQGACRTRVTGTPSHDASLQLIQWARSNWPDWWIIGSGGIIEPAHALAMLAAGADLVQVHSGFVFSGPGLPKRINEAILQKAGHVSASVERADTAPDGFRQSWLFPSWFWGVLLGIGMITGGALAWLVATTSVVLPYDERFLGATAEELGAMNTRLLPFMSHDRISLAGTMISIGVLYYYLARYGLRAGLHWARQVLLVSGGAGFASFLLFLGYGYLDYLHAILSLLLFPLFLLAIRAPASKHVPKLPPQLHNDKDWKCALWGQLFFVIIGFGLTGAGTIISLIGITGVFVPADLAFLCAAPETLQAYNDKLIPLIAHDRAGFGGALVSDGLAVLLLSLWGIRQGEHWIWWALFLGGLPGFLSGIGVHFAVGYVDFLHLLPAYVALLLFLAGLMLTRPYLCKKQQASRE